jgi:predicted GNAT family acetyltransferase
MADVQVIQNEAESRFEVREGEQVAYLTYELRDGGIVLVETQVPKAMEGKGIGSALAKTALNSAQASGKRVTVECPFIQSYIERHPEYQDLLRQS